MNKPAGTTLVRLRPGAVALLLAAAGCGPTAATDSVIVPLSGATFTMGSNADCRDASGSACTGDRVPHKVRVSPFRMDVTEVSKKQYAACVKAGACPAAGAVYNDTDDIPVLVDDPESARKFCSFRKPAMRLPTEAEFEFASRVQPSGNTQAFAWGDEPPSCARLPLAGCDEKATRAVGTSPGDISPWGIKDLAGNVPEWVEDSYTAYTGCADHMSYGELCWGHSQGCVDARCGLDTMFCAKGCLPAPAPQPLSTAMMGMGPATLPVCLAAPVATTLYDPVVHSSSPFGVVRGGSFVDSACAFAGFSRRYAAPKSFSAGFRCAISDGKRVGVPTYRFAVSNCPPSGRVKVGIKTPDGHAAGYSLDYFAAGATGVHSISTCGADDTATQSGCVTKDGTIDELPCDSVMVVYPPSADSISIQLTTVSNPTCLGATQKVPLNAGADTPSVGVDTIPLMPANGC